MVRRVAVAASGGRDSTALLHATARAARELGVEVHALHIHHGLVPQADAWWAQVEAQCRRWRAGGLPVHFHAHRLIGLPPRGASVEAWARRERYAALSALAHSLAIDLVLLAHHRRDQAETVLLQLLRGAGAAGLAAMPRQTSRSGLTWARPWLEQPRESIETYVRRYRLGHVDDASNADRRFVRNALRHDVWPALAETFPDLETTLPAAARRAHEAAECLSELAADDARQCVDTTGTLEIAAWCRLSQARRANLLRHWLQTGNKERVPGSLVERLVIELPQTRNAATWPMPGALLRLHRGRLARLPMSTRNSPPDVLPCDLSRPGRHEVPAWGGAFIVRRARAGQGIAASRLQSAELRARRGAEQFQREPRSVARSLKKQFQAAGVPAGDRAAPLVFGSGQLLFVPGLGTDARAGPQPGERACTIEWVRSPPG